jgi:hypothetical protein
MLLTAEHAEDAKRLRGFKIQDSGFRIQDLRSAFSAIFVEKFFSGVIDENNEAGS